MTTNTAGEGAVNGQEPCQPPLFSLLGNAQTDRAAREQRPTARCPQCTAIQRRHFLLGGCVLCPYEDWGSGLPPTPPSLALPVPLGLLAPPTRVRGGQGGLGRQQEALWGEGRVQRGVQGAGHTAASLQPEVLRAEQEECAPGMGTRRAPGRSSFLVPWAHSKVGAGSGKMRRQWAAGRGWAFRLTGQHLAFPHGQLGSCSLESRQAADLHTTLKGRGQKPGPWGQFPGERAAPQ